MHRWKFVSFKPIRLKKKLSLKNIKRIKWTKYEVLTTKFQELTEDELNAVIVGLEESQHIGPFKGELRFSNLNIEEPSKQ